MTVMFRFAKYALLSCLFLILINSVVYAAGVNPQVTIVVDKTQAPQYAHGLDKLKDAFKAKHITFEQTTSLNKAHGKLVIITGLQAGYGTASLLLKSKGHDVPQEAEALTIWKTNWQNKPVWVISGYDDTGLMYGLLDVANRVTWADMQNPMHFVKQVTQKPDVKERGISMYTM